MKSVGDWPPLWNLQLKKKWSYALSLLGFPGGTNGKETAS